MATIQEIMASPGFLSPFRGRRYRVLGKKIVFGDSMTGKTVIIVGRMIDDTLTVDTLPDRFQLTAIYWVLHRHYADSENAAKAQYYYNLFESEWAKTRHQRTGTPLVNLGERF